MAEMFNGFAPETTETLMGIRMNNSKEWYLAHKDAYTEYVHKPMVLLADEVCAFLCGLDASFDARPKVSRAYRDTRFSANKDPIKECKWFFLRKDKSPGIAHDEPTYFFEMSPDWIRFGLGYWPLKAAGMMALRQKVAAAPELAARLVAGARGDDYFTLEGDVYKRKPDIGALPPDAAALCIRKNLTFIRYGQHDAHVCSRALQDTVCKGFAQLQPMYHFFLEAARNTQ